MPEVVNVEVIRQYDPDFTKLGLLYHANERNSVIKKEELEALLPDLGIEFVAIELDHYSRWSRPISPRWDTVAMPTSDFRRLARPMEEFLDRSAMELPEHEAAPATPASR